MCERVRSRTREVFLLCHALPLFNSSTFHRAIGFRLSSECVKCRFSCFTVEDGKAKSKQKTFWWRYGDVRAVCRYKKSNRSGKCDIDDVERASAKDANTSLDAISPFNWHSLHSHFSFLNLCLSRSSASHPACRMDDRQRRWTFFHRRRDYRASRVQCEMRPHTYNRKVEEHRRNRL